MLRNMDQLYNQEIHFKRGSATVAVMHTYIQLENTMRQEVDGDLPTTHLPIESIPGVG